jgi:hypothetical protein
MISSELVCGMDYSCTLYKKTIPNWKFIRSQFQANFFFKNILQVVMVQNVLMVQKYQKKNMFTCNFIQM